MKTVKCPDNYIKSFREADKLFEERPERRPELETIKLFSVLQAGQFNYNSVFKVVDNTFDDNLLP